MDDLLVTYLAGQYIIPPAKHTIQRFTVEAKEEGRARGSHANDLIRNHHHFIK
jgi:hypothetical protein